jgi:2-aminoadipate transaminase
VTVYAAAMADAIPFTRGVPSADMLPVDDFRRALAHAMEREPTVALSYSTGGHPGLRRWIGERYGVPGERVICANGSLEAFAFVTSVLLSRASTRRVLVEAPTYDRSILILQRAGAEVIGIPVDGDGIDTDALAAELERESPAFLYVIPNFQNPSGATMTLERRRRVLELAARHDVVVVEDDPYGLLRWAGESYPTLCELDEGGRVLTLSSFTKTVAPGLRIGYVVAPDGLAAAVGKYAENTYISPCMVSQAGLAAYCEAGYFEPGVERAKQELEARCNAMVESVRAHFPSDAQMVVPQGGYFLWIDLGPGADTTALATRAAEAGVPFVKGADFFADGGGTTSLRLAFSAVPAARIREGIERLGGVIAAG